MGQHHPGQRPWPRGNQQVTPAEGCHREAGDAGTAVIDVAVRAAAFEHSPSRECGLDRSRGDSVRHAEDLIGGPMHEAVGRDRGALAVEQFRLEGRRRRWHSGVGRPSLVGLARQQALEVGHPPLGQGTLQHVESEPVDLDHEQAGLPIGGGGLAGQVARRTMVAAEQPFDSAPERLDPIDHRPPSWHQRVGGGRVARHMCGARCSKHRVRRALGSISARLRGAGRDLRNRRHHSTSGPRAAPADPASTRITTDCHR